VALNNNPSSLYVCNRVLLHFYLIVICENILKITIIWQNELFNGKELKAKHIIFLDLFYSHQWLFSKMLKKKYSSSVWYVQPKERKNLIDLPYIDDHSFIFETYFYNFRNATKKIVKPSVLYKKINIKI
jgi:hypothetical protein